MSATVDERIVAAKFDASDFEKGVNKTIKKLDELKKSLDMKDTTKSVNELSEKVKTSTDSMSGSLEKLTNRLTTFTGMIKQNILSGLAQEVSDVFLKMERAVTGFIRSLGSEQISVGMQKYEQMLTSVRTMMAAGESQNSAYEAIEDLRDYSDQTSYSLSQMTDALSKFRAAGTHLDEATKSVQGIANACAIAGINATDAGRAYYNLAQAYSSGTLKYTDYRSLELLNMTTEKFKKNLLEAAEEAGTLKKLSDDTYKTISKKGEKITAGKKVTIKNIQDALRYGFVTKDVMNKLFGGKYYFSEKEFRKYKDKYTDKYGNIDEAGREKAIADAKKDFNEFAVDAYLAAREARNFTDVMNTLKDVVSTGWSTTFEYLFGKLESATKFFTELAEGPLADIIYKIGEYRNTILGYWNAVGTASEGSGAKMFQDTILNIAEALGILFKTFLQILPGFDELYKKEGEQQPVLMSIGEKLARVSADIATTSLRIKKAMQAFNDWMNSPIIEGGPTRIETIRKTIANLMSVFSIAYKVFEVGFNAIIKLATAASPIFDALSLAFEKMTEPLVDLKNNDKPFKDMEHSANNIITALQPIIDGLSAILGIAGEIGKFFVSMAIDTVTMNLEFFSDALRFLIDIFTGGQSSQSLKEGESTLDKIHKALEGIKEACSNGLSAVKEFLGSLIKDLRVLFGIADENEEKIQNGGFFENLAKFFETNEFVKSAKAWIDKAILDVTNWIKDIPNKIHALGANIYNTLYGLFFKDETKYNGTQLETKTILTPLGEWMDKAIKDIVNFFVTLPDKIIKGVGDVFDWVNQLFDYWFNGDKDVKDNKQKDKETAKKESDKNTDRFDTFLENLKTSIKEWFDDLPNKIRKAFKSIGDFATRLINVVDEFLFGKKQIKTVVEKDKNGKPQLKKITTRYKSGFSKWLDEFIVEVKKFIANIPEYIKEAIKGAGDIVTAIVNALFGTGEKSTSQDASKKAEEGLKKPFLNIDWTSIWNTIKEIGTTLINQIARIFTGTDDVEFNTAWFAQKVAEGIRWIQTEAETAFQWVLDNFPDIPHKIAALFRGENKDQKGQAQGPVGTAISEFAVSIGKFIEEIPSTIAEFIVSALDEIDILWNNFYNSVKNPKAAEEATEYAENEMGYPASVAHDSKTGEKQKTAWEKFIDSIGKVISAAIQTLPTWIIQGIDLAIEGVRSAFSALTDWLNSLGEEGLANEAAKSAEQAMSDTAKATEKAADGKGSSSLLEAIKTLGLTISNLFTVTLPPFISAAWTAISNGVGDIWKGFENIFNGTPEEGWQKDVDTFAKNVREWIETKLPQAISDAWDTVTKLVGQLFAPKKDPYYVDMSHMTDAERAYYSRYIEALQKPYKDAEKKAKENGGEGATSLLTTIKNSLISGFENIGPAVLNGLATALDWLSDIMTIVVDVITGKKDLGKEIEGAYGEKEPELVSAFKRIGQSLKRFFLDTVPTFIGGIVGTIIAEAPKWFGKLILGVNNAMAEASNDITPISEVVEEGLSGGNDGYWQNWGSWGDSNLTNDESAQKQATNVVESVKNFITSITEPLSAIGNNGVLAAVAILVSVGFLLSKLKEVMSFSREIEGVTSILKWTAIILAVSFMGTLIGSLVDLVKNGDQTQIDNATKILDKLTGMLEKVVWIVGIFAGSKLFGLIETVVDKTNNAGKIINNVTTGKNSQVNITNSGLGSGFVNAMGSALTSITAKLLGPIALGAGVEIGSEMFSKAIENTVEAFSMAFQELVSAVDVITEAFDPLLTKLENANSKVDTAIDTIEKMGGLFLKIFETFSTLYNDATGETYIDPSETDRIRKENNMASMGVSTLFDGTTIQMYEFLEVLKKRIGYYIDLSEFLKNIADTANSLTDVTGAVTKVERFMTELGSEGMQNVIKTLLDALYTSYEQSYFYVNEDKFSRIDTAEVLSIVSSTFEMMTSVISTLTSGLTGVTSENTSGLISALDKIKEISDAFGKNDDGKGLPMLGLKLKQFSDYMVPFYKNVEAIPGFGSAIVSETNAKIESLTTLIRALAVCGYNLNNYTDGFKLLPELAENLPKTAEFYGSFISVLNRAIPEDISNERIRSLSAVTDALSMMMTNLGLFNSLVSMNRGLEVTETVYTNAINGIWAGLQDVVNDRQTMEKFGGILAQAYRIVTDPLIDDPAKEAYRVTAGTIAKELFEGIQAALDDPANNYHPVITPVFKLDDAKEEMRQYFANGGFTPEITSTSSISFNAQTDEKLNKIQETLTSIDGRLDTMNKNSASVGDFTSALSGLQIVANTGALVGVMTPAIDKAIGDRVWLLTRRNSLGANP